MRRLLVSLPLCLLLPLVASCGGGGGSSGVDDSPLAKRVRDVAEATENAKTAKTSGTLDVVSKQPDKPESKNTVSSEGVWNFADSEGHQSVDIGGSTVELITKGGSLYTKNPGAKDPAKPWTRTPAKGGARLGTTDPEQALTFLLGASDVSDEGKEDVRGESTTRYDFSIDIDAAAEQLPSGDREAFEKSLSSFKSDELPASIWVDDEGRMRRLRYEIRSESDKASVVITSTMELYEFGVDVTVEPPPAEQVA